MKIAAYIMSVCFSACSLAAFAQGEKEEKRNYNHTDDRGKRHGLWVVTQGERMGEPGYTEFGNYTHGIKIGPWYKLDGEGELQAMETFKNDVKDGEAKYFEKGRLIAVGTYRGLNPSQKRDTFMVEDPITGVQSLRSIETERGTMRHGTWRFYDASTGRLTREEEYQVDEVVFKKDFPMTSEDSVYYKKREAAMPHNKNTNYYKPPANRRTSYSN